MAKKKNVARKSVNKNTRRVSDKVKGDECPNDICPIKKKKGCCKVPEVPKSYLGSFLDFVFPSRTKNE